jgi:hypothetical protein
MKRRTTVVLPKKYVQVSRRLWVEKSRNIQCDLIILISNEQYRACCRLSVANIYLHCPTTLPRGKGPSVWIEAGRVPAPLWSQQRGGNPRCYCHESKPWSTRSQLITISQTASPLKFNPGRLNGSQSLNLRSYHINEATQFFHSARQYKAKITAPVRTKYRVTCFQQCPAVANNKKCCLPYRYGPYVITCSASLLKTHYNSLPLRRVCYFHASHCSDYSIHFIFTLQWLQFYCRLGS